MGPGVVGAVGSTLQFAESVRVRRAIMKGLELDPARLWALRHTVFGLGGAQVAVTGAAIAFTAIAAGLTWQAALIVGIGCALSSTALVIASLTERGQLLTRHGRESFAILLFQDLAVIPLLALLPLLAASPGHGEAHWTAAAKGIAAIAVVIAGSRLVVRPALKFIAGHSSREVFTAAALLLVVGSARSWRK
jgi:Kef-type K+ transport system membrane component KefB